MSQTGDSSHIYMSHEAYTSRHYLKDQQNMSFASGSSIICRNRSATVSKGPVVS